MTPTEQIFLAILAILSTLATGVVGFIGARAYSAKRKADAELEQVKSDSQVKLAQVKEDADEKAFIREQLKAQIQINEQGFKEREEFRKLLVEKEAKDESNYRVMSNVQKDTQIQITNLVNAIGALNKSMVEHFDRLPSRIAAGNAESLKAFAKEMAAETGAVMAQQFAIQNLDRELFPFPDPEDPAWREEWIKPVTPEPTIHKQPYFADAVKLSKPCAQIKAEGERARVIRNRIKGWIIVDKVDGSRCWGWLPEHTVEISPLLPSLAPVTA